MLAEAQKPALGKIADYLLAAREAMRPVAGQAQNVKIVAGQHGLDAGLVAKWIDELNRARKDPADVLHPWSLLAADAGDDSPKRIAEVLKPGESCWWRATDVLALPLATPNALFARR